MLRCSPQYAFSILGASGSSVEYIAAANSAPVESLGRNYKPKTKHICTLNIKYMFMTSVITQAE